MDNRQFIQLVKKDPKFNLKLSSNFIFITNLVTHHLGHSPVTDYIVEYNENGDGTTYLNDQRMSFDDIVRKIYEN